MLSLSFHLLIFELIKRVNSQSWCALLVVTLRVQQVAG